ncbi:MAG: sigma-70 family RNA polymerase sigma factor [Chloroflexi bacterium]|nr:sigma-70 family RNA polymerase sigma factor [Chloroflexota bacterium]
MGNKPTTIPSPDERLVQQAVRGNLDAFNRLIEIHQQQLYAVALRLAGDSQVASDAVQDAVLSAWQHLSQFHQGSVCAWLTRIVVNRCYDLLRSGKIHRVLSLDDDDDGDASPTAIAAQEDEPEKTVLRVELISYITLGLDQLPWEQRAVVVLFDIQGYAYSEIAETLGVELGTVKSRLSRGRAKLRDWLAQKPELLPQSYRSLFTGGSPANE